MSTKLEECARAICKGCGLNPDAPGPQYQGERIQPLWRRFEDDARAVIRCLMEATPQMLAAALPIIDHPSNTDMRLGADAFTILSGQSTARAAEGIMAGAELARDLRAMLQSVLDEGE